MNILKDSLRVIKEANSIMWVNAHYYPILIITSIIIILLLEKDKSKKALFGFYSLIMIFLIYNPITVIISSVFFDARAVYYCRLFLLVPVLVIIGYSVVLLFEKYNDYKKCFILLMSFGIIYLCGFSAYGEDNTFSKAENMKNVPIDVIELSNLLQSNAGNQYKRVGVPDNLKMYVRQLDASILTTELDNFNVEDASYYNDFIKYIRENKCDYFLCEKKKKIIKAFKKNDMELIGKTKNYAVFKDNNGIKRKYDKLGRVISEQYFGEKSKWYNIEQNVYRIDWEYDDNNNIICEKYYDNDGKPCNLQSGEFGYKKFYDKNNRVIKQTYINSEGLPTNTSYGYASIQYEYNDGGYVIRNLYYDSNNNLTVVSPGYAIVEFERRADGMVIGEFYFDVNGNPISMSTGQCGYTLEYDENYRITKCTYIDKSRKPVMLSSGYAIVHYNQYDDNGNAEYIMYCDENDEPVYTNASIAGIRYVYDEVGNIVEEYYLDKWGNTMVLTTGQSGRKIMYNEDYNISGYVYVDGHGNPVTLSSGFSIVRYSDFDKSGNYRKERYYDKYDNPVVISLGYAGIDYLRDQNGKIECYVYVDVLGNATNNKSGYAYHKIVYDEKGEIIKQILLNVDGEEIEGK